MKIDAIELLWQEDSVIDRKDLGAEALKIPMLHSKWYKIYMEEKLLLSQIKAKIEEFEIVLESYFLKTMTVEELKLYNLTYSDKKILRQDVSKNIATYPEMIELKLKCAVQIEKCEFIKDILKMIHGRSFILKDAIEWCKFTAGTY